jgi:hypothetical protein
MISTLLNFLVPSLLFPHPFNTSYFKISLKLFRLLSHSLLNFLLLHFSFYTTAFDNLLHSFNYFANHLLQLKSPINHINFQVIFFCSSRLPAESNILHLRQFSIFSLPWVHFNERRKKTNCFQLKLEAEISFCFAGETIHRKYEI